MLIAEQLEAPHAGSLRGRDVAGVNQIEGHLIHHEVGSQVVADDGQMQGEQPGIGVGGNHAAPSPGRNTVNRAMTL